MPESAITAIQQYVANAPVDPGIFDRSDTPRPYYDNGLSTALCFDRLPDQNPRVSSRPGFRFENAPGWHPSFRMPAGSGVRAALRAFQLQYARAAAPQRQ